MTQRKASGRRRRSRSPAHPRFSVLELINSAMPPGFFLQPAQQAREFPSLPKEFRARLADWGQRVGSARDPEELRRLWREYEEVILEDPTYGDLPKHPPRFEIWRLVARKGNDVPFKLVDEHGKVQWAGPFVDQEGAIHMKRPDPSRFRFGDEKPPGRPRLSPKREDEIPRTFARTRSKRRAAKETGVDRKTVDSVIRRAG